MITVIKNEGKIFFSKIDKYILFIGIVLTLMVIYYLNPLDNAELTKWNRTFCLAVLNGTSIDRRIGNLYLFFFIQIPAVYILSIGLLNGIFSIRKSYKLIWFYIATAVLPAVLTCYLTRFSDYSTINENLLLEVISGYMVLLTILALLDRKEILTLTDITMSCVGYVIAVISAMVMFRVSYLISIMIVTVFMLLYYTIVLRIHSSERFLRICNHAIYMFMWLPAFIRLMLEGIYFLTEKGRTTLRYYTYISLSCVMFAVVVFIAAFLLRKRKEPLSTFGYIGAIVSMGAMAYFSYEYQYVWSYGSMANIYEAGNWTVAMDSVLYGKLPIIDYFSAHALGDVWTRILYCVIHGDLKGILVDPYGGISILFGMVILFWIVRNFFSKELSILYVLFFPGSIVGIKWTSLCLLSVVMLLYIYKKPLKKNYVFFWLVALLCAFMTYDEGISLGIACILAYIVSCFLEKAWDRLRDFIICGVAVGGIAGALYGIYGMTTGIPIVARLKEWLSVSAGSSSSWATENFGDVTSFAFQFSYFVVPITVISLIVITFFKYIRKKEHRELGVVTTAFVFTELLYITRTVVYHNLAVCAGRTGVLLNFIHWTVSLYVLYFFSLKDKKIHIKYLVFTGTMYAVILMEGICVTGNLPSERSVLTAEAVNAGKRWDLNNHTSQNWHKDRIIYNDETITLIEQFRRVFDILMTEDQTFIDFANVTSMYLLTERVRPCYVGQSPSLLTDLYSQERFLDEISKYDCPLAVVGTSDSSYLQQMVGIPHNIRYYKIAEHIYKNYRPLIAFGEFAIWCEVDLYEQYSQILRKQDFEKQGYSLIDYGYDFTKKCSDGEGNIQDIFQPYHVYDLNLIPYIWASYDDYGAVLNREIESIDLYEKNQYKFEGSQTVLNEKGNYLRLEAVNASEKEFSINMIFYDSTNEGAKVQYYFTVVPGTNQYLIRVSGDYFWDIYNIDTILFGSNEYVTINAVSILEGD